MTRGLTVNALLGDGYSVVATGIISSLIFGLLHFINFFNGQDAKTTTMQVISTILAGANFYIMFVISGTLWLPIIVHALFDFSVLVQGGQINKHPKQQVLFDTILVLVLYVLAIIGLIALGLNPRIS